MTKYIIVQPVIVDYIEKKNKNKNCNEAKRYNQ